MALFAVTNSTNPAGGAQVTMTTSYLGIIAVYASTGNTNQTTFSNPQALKRGRLYDILIGTNGAPADNFLEWEVCRVSAGTSFPQSGTVSSVSSAYMLDLADAAFGSGVVANTSQGSSAIYSRAGAQAWYVGINQRASYRWVAAPGSEIVWPANSSTTGFNGLALDARSGAYTGTVTATIMVSEL
jgi:hypothetical protein